MSETKEGRTLVRKVKGGALFSDGTIRLENVRLSYPHLVTPQSGKSDDGTETESYACVMLMPKDTHKGAMHLCRDAVNEFVQDAMKKDKKFKGLPSERKFIKDGDTTGKPENEGMWVVAAREKKKPALRGPYNDPKTGKPERLTDAAAKDMFYGGCYGTVLIRPWWMDNKYGKRCSANLLAVQFLRDGDPFGEGRIGEDDIDDSFEGTDNEDGGWEDENEL